MRTPNFNNNQFVDPTLLNTGFATVSGSIAMDARTSLPTPGLLFPEYALLSVNGFSLLAVLPAPFAIVNVSGVIADAHGTVTGQDNILYTLSFSGLVPSVGSATAYLVAQFTTIQQNPVPISGPPPGHPSYNPNFVPGTGYSVNIDTLNLTASLTAPDNRTQFEVARCTLTAGTTGLSAFTTRYQQRAAHYKGWPVNPVTNSGALSSNAALYVNEATTGPLTTTLPAAALYTGTQQWFVNSSSSTWTISANPGDTIFAANGALSTLAVQPSGAALLWCDGAAWYVQARSTMPPLASRPRVLNALPYTVLPSDCGAMLETTVAGTINLNPPAQGLPIGFNVALWCSSNPPLSVVAAGGPLIFGPGTATQGVTGIALGANDFLNLVYDGFNWIVLGASAWMLRNAGISTFTSSANFTVPPNVTSVTATVIGGGGGATGSDNTANFISGAGGGAGGYSKKRITGLTPGQVIPVTVGLGGTGVGINTTANAGGTSSFGPYNSATGGNGGGSITSNSAGGSPGIGSGGDVNAAGGYGGDGQSGSVTGMGNGGASFFGGGGRAAGGTGINGLAPGSGAGAAYAAVANGGNGAPGIVIVEWDV